MTRAYYPKNSTASALTAAFSKSRAGGLSTTALTVALDQVAFEVDRLPAGNRKTRAITALRDTLIELEQHTYDIDAGEEGEEDRKVLAEMRQP